MTVSSGANPTGRGEEPAEQRDRPQRGLLLRLPATAAVVVRRRRLRSLGCPPPAASPRPQLVQQRLTHLAVGETVILLHPPLPSVGVSIAMESGCQQMTVSPAATLTSSWCCRPSPRRVGRPCCQHAPTVATSSW